MKSFNLCDESWINVRYSDGHVAKLGLVKIFEEADKIDAIMPPVFRKEPIYLYVALTVRLLTIIVMSAYYKSETKYASRSLLYLDELKTKGLNTNVIKAYLEKYHDRFDLYSETYPFLQNIAVKDLPDVEDYAYIYWNPFVPSGHNPLFGKVRTIDTTKEKAADQYRINSEEFAYFLLYLAMIGGSPMAAHYTESSLVKTGDIFVVIKGDTLKDTIIYNIVPLDNSSRPNEEDDDQPDMPVWELNSISEIDAYELATLANNKLLCSFYPGISVLCTETDENDNPKRIKRVKKEDIPSNIIEFAYGTHVPTKELSKNWSDYTCVVNNLYIEKLLAGTLDETAHYKKYKIYESFFSVCISATENVGAHYMCGVLKNLSLEANRAVEVYYRYMDEKKVSVLSFGCINNRNIETWCLLRDAECHEVARKYQDSYYSVCNDLRSSLEKVSNNKDIKCKSRLCGYLSNWMEDDFFGQFTVDLKDNIATAYECCLDRLIHETLCVFNEYCDDCVKRGCDYIEIVKERKALQIKLNKYKEKKVDG